jgi:hypothetical protein
MPWRRLWFWVRRVPDRDHNHAGSQRATLRGRLCPLRRLLLLNGRQFVSRTEWLVDKVVVPTVPDFLPARQVASIKENEVHLQDVYHQWGAEVEEPNAPTSRMMKQLSLQLEAHAHAGKWGLASHVGGLTLRTTATVGLCLARRCQIVTLLCHDGSGPRTPTTTEQAESGAQEITGDPPCTHHGDLLSEECIGWAVRTESVQALSERNRWTEKHKTLTNMCLVFYLCFDNPGVRPWSEMIHFYEKNNSTISMGGCYALTKGDMKLRGSKARSQTIATWESW